MPIVNRVTLTTTGDFQDGLDATGPHQLVLNFAPVSTTGLAANGIADFGQGAHVINRDAITLTGDGGINILVVGDHPDVSNFAVLSNLGASIDPDGIPFDGDETFAEGIVVAGDHFSVTDRGDIIVTGDLGAGIEADGSDGRIENDSTLSAPGDSAVGIVAVGARDVAVNNGAINVGFAGAGVLLVGDNGSITNTGAVSAVGDFAIGLIGVGDREAITNAHGATVTSQGFEAFGIYAQGNNGSISNAGQVIVSGEVNFGLIVEGANGFITNTGAVSATGDVERAAYIQDHSTLVNRGDLGADGQSALGALVLGDGNSIQNFGSIHTTGMGGAGLQVGFDVNPGAGQAITNWGSILATGDSSWAVGLFASQSSLLNHGLIAATGAPLTVNGVTVAANGLDVFGDEDTITNAGDGRVYSHNAASPAVEINVDTPFVTANPLTHTSLENDGLIHGDGLAILGGAASEAVFNFGRIEGDVNLGGGADRFEAESGGVLAGTLTLGGGADTLALHHNFGALTVADFTPGGAAHDVLDVSALGIKTLSAFLSSASQSGGDVVVNLGHGDVLTLKSLTLASLTAGDFIFAH